MKQTSPSLPLDGLMTGFVILVVFFLMSEVPLGGPPFDSDSQKGPSFSSKGALSEDVQELLSEILEEVEELEAHGEAPILLKREFWIDLDANDTNKEEHIVVMQHSDGLNQKVTLQVTYFSSDRSQRFVRYASDTKLILCVLQGKGFKILRCDYPKEETEKTLRKILAGIRNKKKLLGLIKKKRPPSRAEATRATGMSI